MGSHFYYSSHQGDVKRAWVSFRAARTSGLVTVPPQLKKNQGNTRLFEGSGVDFDAKTAIKTHKSDFLCVDHDIINALDIRVLLF